MRVLVTGHAGYIGPVMIRHLLAAGHEPVGLDSMLFQLESLGPPPPEVPFFRCDVRDVDASHFVGVDAVVHLAALSNDPLGALSPGVTEAVNHEATVAVAEAARDAGVSRFVFSGSCSAYGAGTPGEWLDESAPLNPLTAYAVSKVRAEHDLAALDGPNFTTVTMRNATAYGYSPLMRTDLVVNELVARAVIDGQVELRTSGVQWRPLVHVDDIARAAVAAMEAPSGVVGGRAFNVGADAENYRIRDVAELIANALPGAAVVFADGAEPDRRDYRVRFDALAEALPTGVPQWTLANGIRQLADIYTRYGVTSEVLTRFNRLAHLTERLEAGAISRSVRWVEESAHA